ncbi:biotin--[acetyl-CoA-carboxylase] ligase [Arthrobacter sp. KK5.5]|uniref:biotin--[acetyl-CoA-carboxylase] ligase n=1 Tax=Arthrobacter sp. KK5.5 TaxID=3373084 RepID=UPI003EE620D2
MTQEPSKSRGPATSESTPRPTDDRAPLDGAALRSDLLAPAGPFARVETVESTGSTNADIAASAAADPAEWPDLCVLATDFQSAGKGRLERVWQAPPRSALAVSVLFRPTTADGGPLPAGAYGWLSMLCALALAESIGASTAVEARIKWPNDVLVGGKKVAGLLAQLVAQGPVPAVVVGSGVNVGLTEGELPVPTATSLLLEGASTTDNTVVLTAYLRRVAELYRGFVDEGGEADAGLRERVAARMATLGARVRAELPDGSTLEGEAVGLDADGALRIRSAQGTETALRAGDVVHLRRADGEYS